MPAAVVWAIQRDRVTVHCSRFHQDTIRCRTCFEHNAGGQRHGEKIGMPYNAEFSMLTLGLLSLASANDTVWIPHDVLIDHGDTLDRNGRMASFIWVAHRLCHHILCNFFGSFEPCHIVQDRIRRRPVVFKPECGAGCAMLNGSTCRSVFTTGHTHTTTHTHTLPPSL